MSSYKFEVVHTDGTTFSIHKNRDDADYWAGRIGGKVIDYEPRHNWKDRMACLGK